jgi:dipeptidase E
MPLTRKQIVAFGGGGFSQESGNPLLDDFTLSLTGKEMPRVCFMPTASGDADHYIVRFYNAFRECARPSHISLFRRERGVSDVREHLLAQDVIYVGGGSVISLLGTWRAHGIDEIIRDAWEKGVVLCGLSAGSLCWFEDALTAFHGESSRVRGLGLLPFSNTVHYDAEPQRRSAFRRALLDGMCTGYAAEDGAALHFVGAELAQVVASRPNARAYRLTASGDRVVETRLATRYLDCDSEPLPMPGDSYSGDAESSTTGVLTSAERRVTAA